MHRTYLFVDGSGVTRFERIDVFGITDGVDSDNRAWEDVIKFSEDNLVVPVVWRNVHDEKGEVIWLASVIGTVPTSVVSIDPHVAIEICQDDGDDSDFGYEGGPEAR